MRIPEEKRVYNFRGMIIYAKNKKEAVKVFKTEVVRMRRITFEWL